ncbi:universal stress protein PHOS34-like [Lycium barbarum]|uniref:universal stress protein PHOS34-like n=1 Tax=Lycium barbarum TaxID=112863 RepID=UPI00293E98F4|nr:universal stress protein PHOS34-like [Lycium barbarum]
MRVAVAIDNSEESYNALKWILDYLLTQPSTKLTLVHVMEPLPPFHGVESASRAQAQEAARILARASEMCKAKMINAESLILEGDPKNLLCEATAKMNVDLLAIASRGLGQIKRAFLGSVSDYCAHHAKCPVLIVKPTKESPK